MKAEGGPSPSDSALADEEGTLNVEMPDPLSVRPKKHDLGRNEWRK